MSDMGAKGPRILAVDDSEDLREFYELALELAGYTVALAADGREALAMARELRPDVIITDVSMPVMDGLELLVRLRSDLLPPPPPIIVCSGFDMTEATAMRLGAFRFLPKPFEREDLLAAVTQALQGISLGADALAQEKERIHRARERAAAVAAVALRDIDFDAPKVAADVQGFAQRIADYFGFGATALAFVDGGDLRVRGASQGSAIASGTVFDGDALYSSGVLATGASLVVADASAHAFAGERVKKYGIRSFVGVPILSGGIPVGTICLFDAVPRSFTAEDLLILEQFGRGALQRPDALPSAADRVGVVIPRTFRTMLAAELALHRRSGGSLDLAIVQYASGSDVGEVLDALLGATTPFRLGVTHTADGITLFKRDLDDTGASRVISAALAAMATVAPLRAAGWVSLGSRLPSPSAADLLELARGALEQAHEGALGTIERLELKREPWRSVTPAPI